MLINVLETFRKVFSFADPKPGTITNMLDLYCATNTEGIDATYEHVWETAHPYPKQDLRQTEVIKVPRAIGYYVEFDPRSCTPSGNDYLQLKTSETETNMGEQVGTRFKTSGRIAPGQNVFILIGKQLEIEFLVKVPRERGRKPGEPDGRQQNSDDKQRWGFRLSILPIFMYPVYTTTAVFKDIANTNRLDQDHQDNQTLYKWFKFFTLAVYVASAYT
jgi:hypothetical protein